MFRIGLEMELYIGSRRLKKLTQLWSYRKRKPNNKINIRDRYDTEMKQDIKLSKNKTSWKIWEMPTSPVYLELKNQAQDDFEVFWRETDFTEKGGVIHTFLLQ
jgi:hypothetical protein